MFRARSIHGGSRRQSTRVKLAGFDCLESRQLPSTLVGKSVLDRNHAISIKHLHHSPAHIATAPASKSVAKTAADSDCLQTFTVPLKLVSVGAEKRLSIDVSVAGGSYRPYLLDTGSTGLYVANYDLNSANYTTTSTNFAQHYSSGIQYSGPVINTSISLMQGESASNVYLGLITQAKGKLIPNWNKDLSKGTPPYQNSFYGTLGMSLEPGTAQQQGNLYSIIAQLPGNLNSGFIVHTGGIDGTSPTLTVGLTPQNTQGFVLIKIPPASSSATSFDSTYSYGNGLANSVPAWDDKGAQLTYSITGMPSFSANTTFDTGDASTTIYTGGVPHSLISHGMLESDLEFAAQLSGSTSWQFETGPTANVNQVLVGGKRTPGTVNTGIGLFFNYDVLYDIKDGYIGFRPV